MIVALQYQHHAVTALNSDRGKVVRNSRRLFLHILEGKSAFRSVLADATGDACSLPMIRSIHAQLNLAMEEHKTSKEPEPLTVDKYVMRDMLEFCGVPAENVEQFEEKFDKGFGQNAALSPRNIVDTNKFEVRTPDVVIKVNPARTDLVDTRVIDGVRYVLVRADGGVEVNGIDVRIETEEE